MIIDCNEYKVHKDRYIAHSNGMVTVTDVSGNTMSISVNDKRYLNGELVPIWTGRKHSVETKRKLSETYKRTQHQKGEKNSQYGTCWITKDAIDKKVPKIVIDEYLKDGWKRGRYVNKEKINYKTDDIKKEKVIELYERYRSWEKVAKELGIGKGSLLRYRRRKSINLGRATCKE